jgi:hypothetical protein
LASNVLDQHVSLGEQDREGEADRVGLALDDGLDGGSDPVRRTHQVVECVAGVVTGIQGHPSS